MECPHSLKKIKEQEQIVFHKLFQHIFWQRPNFALKIFQIIFFLAFLLSALCLMHLL